MGYPLTLCSCSSSLILASQPLGYRTGTAESLLQLATPFYAVVLLRCALLCRAIHVYIHSCLTARLAAALGSHRRDEVFAFSNACAKHNTCVAAQQQQGLFLAASFCFLPS